MNNLIKARVLWIEDFDGQKNNIELEKCFLKDSGLDKCEIDWAYNFEDFLSKINCDDVIYDTIIIDVNVPAKSEDYEKISEYIEEGKFKEYIEKSNGEEKSTTNLIGCIVALYLLQSKLFKQDRICFYSANIYDNVNDPCATPEDVLYSIGNNLSDISDMAHWYNNIFSKLKAHDNPNKGNQGILRKKNRQVNSEICPIIKLEDFKSDSANYPENLLKYIDSEEFKEQYKSIDNTKLAFQAKFKDFMEKFESTGMKFLPFFEKKEVDSVSLRSDFHRFLQSQNDENKYYQFRFAVINMCNILYQWLNDTPNLNTKINLNIFDYDNNFSKKSKYHNSDFRVMLSNIISYLKEVTPCGCDEKRIYKDIAMSITIFAEKIQYYPQLDHCNNEKLRDPLYPMKRTIKALRNALYHNSTSFESAWDDMSFCSFIIGIGLRLYFNMSDDSFKSYRNDYNKMEEILLGCISSNNECPDGSLIKTIVSANPTYTSKVTDSDKRIPAYNKLTDKSKNNYDIYKLYVLCTYFLEYQKEDANNVNKKSTFGFNYITGYDESSIEVEYMKRAASLIITDDGN